MNLKIAEKLKSVLKRLKGSLSRLALKALIFSILLFLLGESAFGIVIFVLAAIILFAKPGHNSLKHGISFLTLTSVSLAITEKFRFFADMRPDSPVFYALFLASVAFFGFLFYLLLGIKNYTFIRRRESYYLLNSLLFLSVFGLFFSADRSGLFVLKQILTGVASFLLFREAFNILTEEEHVLSIETSKFATALVFSLMIFQIIWAISILPIGFINSASLALLCVLILEDLAINHWSGTLTRRLMLRDASFFLFMVAIIFVASKWVL